jgi:hypothetical protein
MLPVVVVAVCRIYLMRENVEQDDQWLPTNHRYIYTDLK